ncbi:dihydroxyacetone kinase subunit DhaK [Aliiruegeria sabulilitoris]|uniref:dihydroxyacetone kinase subunit DhaK n=1 Tax=Aliiruegeria sabulilitoris TaxID=1510458 RepID=UPI00083342D2|nr:dihydroxyacetone kinase subunit DhaK [Aliiruegeria sabulilitoris]NDR56301.1 dihydroxyacetone kinase subunit DhaK [Pseudoruegeria sp. M32A2M]
MKKIINDREDLVPELLEGFSLAYSDAIRIIDDRIVVRRSPKPDGKVALVTLGGSGHEPALSGFVGTGLLDTSVPGEIFAAPGPDRCVRALQMSDRGAGVLFLVLNHAGDVLTANYATERVTASGLNARMIVVNDDIASGAPEQKENRRGLVGILPVIKIAGAAAEAGLPLDVVADLAEAVVDNTRTLGVGFREASHPVTGASPLTIPENSMVVGMGQHGERTGETFAMTNADSLAEMMVSRLVEDLGVSRGDELLVLLNGAGATSLMELFIVFRQVWRSCVDRGITVARSKIGEFVTAQEQAGFQINITRLTPEMKKHWDAPCSAPFFPTIFPPNDPE